MSLFMTPMLAKLTQERKYPPGVPSAGPQARLTVRARDFGLEDLRRVRPPAESPLGRVPQGEWALVRREVLLYPARTTI